MSKNQIAGKYISSLNDQLGLSIKPQPIYQSKGLKTHMLKSKHYIALKYIDIKTDSNTKQLYIATMYDLPRKKLDRMLYANKVLKVID